MSGERGRGIERKGRIGCWWNDVPGKEKADQSASGTASSPFLSNATRRVSRMRNEKDQRWTRHGGGGEGR